MNITKFKPLFFTIIISLLFNQCSKSPSSHNVSDLFLSQISNNLNNDDEILQTWVHDHKFDDVLVLVKLKSDNPYDLSQKFSSYFDLTEIPDDQKSRSYVVTSLFERAGLLNVNKDQQENLRVWIRDRDDGVIYMVLSQKDGIIMLGKSDQ